MVPLIVSPENFKPGFSYAKIDGYWVCISAPFRLDEPPDETTQEKEPPSKDADEPDASTD